MPQPGSQPEGDEWRRALGELEARVFRIEQRLEMSPAAPAHQPPAEEPARVAWREGASAVPIVGRALLGLAGAYVLRALTEARTLPQKAGVIAAILYAVLWLVWAARRPAGRRAETVLYSLTSALVLGPLLWESTLRLGALTTWAAAAVLLGYTLFGLIVSWRKNLLVVATIATLTGVLTAAALLIGSDDVAPFVFLMLAIAAAVEVSACLDHWLNERWLTAAAADLAILLGTYLVTNARGLPESYVPIPLYALLGAQMALPAIYLSSTLVRTLLREHTVSRFETVQLAVSFLLGVGGGLRLGGYPLVIPAMAVVCLLCAAVCYGVAFFERDRNFHTYASFGFLLALAGTRIALPATAAAVVWALLAMVGMAAGRLGLRWHGCLYLLCALAGSGALTQATGLVLGGSDSRAAPAAVWGVAAAAVACYVLALRGASAGRLLRAIVAGCAFWLVGGVAAGVLTAAYHQLFGSLAPHAYCATLRTGVLALSAVLLAWAGAVWKRAELVPLVYLAMGLGAYRLLLVDLRQDAKAALVCSLLLYGAALMIVPRLIQPSRAATS